MPESREEWGGRETWEMILWRPRSENKGKEVPQEPEQQFPCSPLWGPHQSSYQHCSPWRSPHQSRWVFPEGIEAHGEPVLDQVYLKDCSPWRTHIATDLSWRRCPMLEQNSLRKDRVAEMNCCELAVMPIPSPPCAAWGGWGGRELEMKEWRSAWGKKIVGGRCCYSFVFVFLLPNLF